MEIERLAFGLSHADKIRAAELRWRGMPPGIPPAMAVEFMAKLKAGSTVRKLTGGGKLGPNIVSFDRFKKHCQLHPEWASEAWRISKINCSAGKGAALRLTTHCRAGLHLMTGVKCVHRWIARQKALPRLQTSDIRVCAADGR